MKALASIAFVIALIMVSLNIYPSWSQHARTLEEPLLFATLLSIINCFMIRSYTAINRDNKVFKNITVSQLDFTTAIFFSFVLVFPVTHPDKWIEIAHFIFTALAIITAYLNMVLQQTEKMMKIASKFAFVVALALFLIGMLTNWYNVGIGEILVTVALIIHVYNTKTMAF